MASRGQGADDSFFAAAAEAAREHGKVIPADDHLVATDEKNADDFVDGTQHVHETPEGFLAPTSEEMETLRHVSDYINWSTYCEHPST